MYLQFFRQNHINSLPSNPVMSRLPSGCEQIWVLRKLTLALLSARYLGGSGEQILEFPVSPILTIPHISFWWRSSMEGDFDFLGSALDLTLQGVWFYWVWHWKPRSSVGPLSLPVCHGFQRPVLGNTYVSWLSSMFRLFGVILWCIFGYSFFILSNPYNFN